MWSLRVKSRLGTRAARTLACWAHPNLVLTDLGKRGKGFVATANIPAGALLIREAPLAVAANDEALPRAVVSACSAHGPLASYLALLSPRHATDGNETSDEARSAAHAAAVCRVNATCAVNIDDFAPLALSRAPGRNMEVPGDPLLFDLTVAGRTRFARSPGGSSLPTYRSLLNHSCRANTATLHHAGLVEVRAVEDMRDGDEATAEYLAGLNLLQCTEGRRKLLHANWGFACGCRRCREGATEGADALHVPPTRGWMATAAEAMRGVKRGAAGAAEMLGWLAERQRAHADGPSYSEGAVLTALARVKAAEAFGSAMSGDSERAAAAALAARSALASQLPLIEACLPAAHPARVPALLAASLVALCQEDVGEDRGGDRREESEPSSTATSVPIHGAETPVADDVDGDTRGARQLLRRGTAQLSVALNRRHGGGDRASDAESLRHSEPSAGAVTSAQYFRAAAAAHDTAFGGGMELLRERYGDGHLVRLLAHHDTQLA